MVKKIKVLRSFTPEDQRTAGEPSTSFVRSRAGNPIIAPDKSEKWQEKSCSKRESERATDCAWTSAFSPIKNNYLIVNASRVTHFCRSGLYLTVPAEESGSRTGFTFFKEMLSRIVCCLLRCDGTAAACTSSFMERCRNFQKWTRFVRADKNNCFLPNFFVVFRV